jgi:acyl-[acyl carrier protein]--UDP-N-acetylglucosamine O-acyltransferase
VSDFFTSYGGGVHHSAIIGHPPEHRDWAPGMPAYEPILGPGVRVEAFVTVDAGMYDPTRIGARTWLQKHVHIGHDAVIGEDCEIAPNSTICGHATIADQVRIGVNACVLPYRQVGEGAHIGAGAIVARDVPPGAIVRCKPGRHYTSDGTDITSLVDDEVIAAAQAIASSWTSDAVDDGE